MRRYVRLLPYVLIATALTLVILYLLNTSTAGESPQLRVRSSRVKDLPWEQSKVDVLSPTQSSDISSVHRPATSTRGPGIVHTQKRHRATSTIQTSRHVALDYECRSRNGSIPWRSVPEAVRQAAAQRIVVNDRYKLLYCSVPLLAQGPWMKVMYYITPQAEGLADISKVSGSELGSRKNFVYLNSFSLEEQEKRLNSYLSFMVSRHPFQRLAIAYKFKFESNNAFFHDRYGKVIVNKYRRGAAGGSPSGDDVKFSEFARFVTEAESGDMNEHWLPLETLCQPCGVDYDLILHHETMERDAQELLEIAGLTSRVPKFPYDKWDSVEMTYVHRLYQDLSPALVGSLVKRYRADFGMFSYSSLL